MYFEQEVVERKRTGHKPLASGFKQINTPLYIVYGGREVMGILHALYLLHEFVHDGGGMSAEPDSL